jgi:hypothetical protein
MQRPCIARTATMPVVMVMVFETAADTVFVGRQPVISSLVSRRATA